MQHKARFYKKIDRLIGPFLVSVLRMLFNPIKTGVGNIESILFIRPGGIGDAVLLIPTIQALKRNYPRTSICVLAEKRNADVFLLCTDVDVVFHYDKPNELFRAIRKEYDVVIDTEQWHRLSAVVAGLTRSRILIGYDTNNRRKIFTHPFAYSHEEYELSSFFNLLKPFGDIIPCHVRKPFLSIPEDPTETVKSLLGPLTEKKMVALFPGGSIEERRWGSDRFHEVAKMLLQRGFHVVIVGGNEDRQNGAIIAAGLPDVVNLCGRLSITETAAVLRHCSLLITGDSGIMHLGYGLGIKILALFGPGIEEKWAPRGKNHIVINKYLPCSPCTKFGYTPRCKNNAACMKQITVEEVYRAAIELLER